MCLRIQLLMVRFDAEMRDKTTRDTPQRAPTTHLDTHYERVTVIVTTLHFTLLGITTGIVARG